MTLRIAVTGPESSGKSTLAQDLAVLLKGVCIPEYARTYLENNGSHYSEQDVLDIGLMQYQLNHSPDNKGIVICDTEMLVIHIWMQVKYGQTNPQIIEHLLNQRFDHYFLCKPDIPWEFDPLRENPNNRWELFERFEKELKRLSFPYSIVCGSPFERLSQCQKRIHQLLSSSCQSSKNS
jgi:NadR type nicotinamide-nucleotide adenylyltransferase